MKWILALVLLFPAAFASEMRIDISIGSNGLVTEDVTISTDQPYDTVAYTSRYEPLDLSSDLNYSIQQQDNYYVYSFPGADTVEFSALYDGFVERSFGERIFRSSFYKEESDSMRIRITLPPHCILAKTEPNVMPMPTSITTDGRLIIMTWELDEDADIFIFYESERSMLFAWVVSLFIAALAAALLFLFFRRRSTQRIHDTLSSEEQKVLSALKKEQRQDQVARNLEFSKSKMSKVVRKLEEKGLIAKEPYFKTNKIKKK